jgi:hypothetical protein
MGKVMRYKKRRKGGKEGKNEGGREGGKKGRRAGGFTLGIWSIREETCACRSSRRSLASWFWVMAARFKEPSGFLTIRGGESSLEGGKEGGMEGEDGEKKR